MLETNSPRREEVVKLKRDGFSNAETARRLGISRQRVGQIMKRSIKKKSTPNSPDTLLSTAQVARLLNIHMNTVRRWSNTRLLPSYRIGSRGDRRFRWDDIEYLLRQGFVKNIPRVMVRLSELESSVERPLEPAAADKGLPR
jgi:excisionase family DNA binding protein